MSIVREWYKEQLPNLYVPEFDDLVQALEEILADFERELEPQVVAATQSERGLALKIAATSARCEALLALIPVWEQRCAELRDTVLRLNRIYWERIGIPVSSLSADERELLLRGELDTSQIALKRNADLRRAKQSVFANPLRWPMLLLSWASGWRVHWGYPEVVKARVAWKFLERRIVLSPLWRFELLRERFASYVDTLQRQIVRREHF